MASPNKKKVKSVPRAAANSAGTSSYTYSVLWILSILVLVGAACLALFKPDLPFQDMDQLVNLVQSMFRTGEIAKDGESAVNTEKTVIPATTSSAPTATPTTTAAPTTTPMSKPSTPHTTTPPPTTTPTTSTTAAPSTAAAQNTVLSDLQKKLDVGEKLLNKPGQYDMAVKYFTQLTETHPNNVHTRYGAAKALQLKATALRSNSVLQSHIDELEKALQCSDITDDLYMEIGRLRADQLHFKGKSSQAIAQMESLISRWPKNITLLNEAGVMHLKSESKKRSRIRAKEIFTKVLELKPADSFALTHLGFIEISYLENYSRGAELMSAGMAGDNEQVKNDSRWYYHLGDAYQRLNHPDKARKVYKAGADRGVFLSAVQRSIYNVDRLTGRPWWHMNQLPAHYQRFLKDIEKNWEVIRDEGLTLIDQNTGLFKNESERLRQFGDWRQFTLFQRGELLRVSEMRHVKFSLLMPGTKVWPHCGPTNCRIRPHIGLKVPDGVGIKVNGMTKVWEEGKFIILDDSFEHEVWHNGTEPRLILIVDSWHPELTDAEKSKLSAI